MFTPTVGVSYYFDFIPEFAPLNGVYHVVQMLTHQECVDTNVDLVSSFYKHVGLTDAQYLIDLESIKLDQILKLVDPDTLDGSTAIYAPMLYMSKVPDHNIKKYYKLALGLNLGVMDNIEVIEAVISSMKEQVTASTGVTDDPRLFEISSTWLTTDQYAAIEATRDQSAKRIISYFTENVRLQKEVDRLKVRIAAYEETLLGLHTAGHI